MQAGWSAASAALQGTNSMTAASATASAASPAAASTPFAELITDAAAQVNALEGQARTAISGLMTGTGVDVHQATIAAEKAEMAFELALSVRNKAVQAYQQVMGMQF